MQIRRKNTNFNISTAILALMIVSSIGCSDGTNNLVSAIDSDSAPDATESGPNPSPLGPNGEITALTPLLNGDTVIAGDFTEYDSVSVPGIVKIDSDGNIDQSFVDSIGTAQQGGTITSISENQDGSISLFGDFAQFNGESVGNVVALQPSGEVIKKEEPLFFDRPVSGVSSSPNGELLVYGDFDGSSLNSDDPSNSQIALIDHTLKPASWAIRKDLLAGAETTPISNPNSVEDADATPAAEDTVTEDIAENTDTSDSDSLDTTEPSNQNTAENDLSEGTEQDRVPASSETTEVATQPAAEQNEDSNQEDFSQECSDAIEELIELKKDLAEDHKKITELNSELGQKRSIASAIKQSKYKKDKEDDEKEDNRSDKASSDKDKDRDRDDKQAKKDKEKQEENLKEQEELQRKISSLSKEYSDKREKYISLRSQMSGTSCEHSLNKKLVSQNVQGEKQ